MRELAKQGYNFILLTFEKPHWNSEESEQSRQLRSRLANCGIEWHYLPYCSFRIPGLPASTIDILAGTLYSMRLLIRSRIRIVHTRSYIPAAIALLLKHAGRVRFVFDMRGLLPDEYVSEGYWTHTVPVTDFHRGILA